MTRIVGGLDLLYTMTPNRTDLTKYLNKTILKKWIKWNRIIYSTLTLGVENKNIFFLAKIKTKSMTI